MSNLHEPDLFIDWGHVHGVAFSADVQARLQAAYGIKEWGQVALGASIAAALGESLMDVGVVEKAAELVKELAQQSWENLTSAVPGDAAGSLRSIYDPLIETHNAQFKSDADLNAKFVDLREEFLDSFLESFGENLANFAPAAAVLDRVLDRELKVRAKALYHVAEKARYINNVIADAFKVIDDLSAFEEKLSAFPDAYKALNLEIAAYLDVLNKDQPELERSLKAFLDSFDGQPDWATFLVDHHTKLFKQLLHAQNQTFNELIALETTVSAVANDELDALDGLAAVGKHSGKAYVEAVTEISVLLSSKPKTIRKKRRAGFLLPWKSLTAVAATIAIMAAGGAYHFLGDCSWPLVESCYNLQLKEGRESEEDPFKDVVSLPDEVRSAQFGLPCFAVAENEDHCVDVFFATTREYRIGDEGIKFTRNTADEVSYGIGEVSMAKLLVKPNPLEEPSVEVRLEGNYDPANLEFDFAKPLREVAQRGTRGLTNIGVEEGFTTAQQREAFIFALRTVVSERGNGKVLLFVHGFNQTFDQAVVTGAHLAVDMTLDYENIEGYYENPNAAYELGVPVAFSWPNNETELGYLEDRFGNAKSAAPRLSEFLKLLFEEVGASEINIVVHSLGNRVFSNSLLDIVENGDDIDYSIKEINMIHAAADINHRVYKRRMKRFERFLRDNERDDLLPDVTVYASRNDRALAWSRATRIVTRCRVGRISGPCGALQPHDRDRYDVVEASGFRLKDAFEEGRDDLGHAAFQAAPHVLRDSACALRDIRADDRRRALKETTRSAYVVGSSKYYQADAALGSNECKSVFAITPEMCDRLSDVASYPACNQNELRAESRQKVVEIFFDRELAVMSAKSVQELRNTLSDIGVERISRVYIDGHASTSGDEKLNDQVSADRVRSVTDLLVGNGVDPSLIVSIAHGEKNLPFPTPDGVRDPRNRKAYIRITYAVEVEVSSR